MWIHNLNPTILDLGPVEIRWYGLVYVLGFFLAIWWLSYYSKKGKINLTKDEVWDFGFYLLLGVIIGSRLFEIFWEPAYYLSNPFNLLKIWQGGMSFHGGLVGIVVACWWYCKKKKLNFWIIADILSVPLILVLALGRVANFINGELVGRVWNGSWCVVFPDYGSECRHPNMIYSFFQRMAVFGGLLWLSLKKEFTPGQATNVRDLSPTTFTVGFVFWNFVFWEGLGRFLVDFFREDFLYLGLSLGQWFSMVMILAALIMFWKRYQQDWKKIWQKHY